MESKIEIAKKQLALLLPYFFDANTLNDRAVAIYGFLAETMPVDMVTLVKFGGERHELEAYSGGTNGRLAGQLKETFSSLTEAGVEKAISQDAQFVRLIEQEGGLKAFSHKIFFDKSQYGLLAVARLNSVFTEEEERLVTTLSGIIGATFALRASVESEKRSSFVFNAVMDRMKTSTYITDINTDRILFMNQAMKEDFKIPNPEGMRCYKVLQRGMDRRCSFCPVDRLQKEGGGSLIQWDELNTVTGRSYQNYDSLIQWVDGSTVHLQQSIDVTELKTANTDELTQLLSRRPGKLALKATLERAQKEDRLVTVCFYDINDLKEVNDRFGHAEGDRVISDVASVVSEVLHDDEYAFRMSGDEFVVVFMSGQKNASWRMAEVQKRLREMNSKYEIGFCYGLVEVQPDKELSAEEAILLADEHMYENKRRFHIMRNRRRLQEGVSSPSPQQFLYDKNLLYDALAQSTDDYPYVCNMKTGVFRYAPAMVEEFALPGEVIENAAAVWGAKVHEGDRAAFLEANQEIEDGRAVSHCVEYRAMNHRGEWVWVRCRGHVEMDENGEPELFAGFITNLGKKNKIDGITGLFNKVEFQETIEKQIESAKDTAFGVMILDMDDLNHINDLYDRTFGDEVIRITSQKLRTLLPPEASVYRLDGDEFGIIALGYNGEKLQKLYRTINYSFENQQEHDGKKYYCTLSGGTVLYPRDAKSYLEIMKCAGYSLEYAKRHGKKCCVQYSIGILNHRSRALEMVEELRESVEDDFRGFNLRFQPLVEASTGRVLGAEALARWQCERFGQISPVEFIPLLEETGMILPFGKWVIQTAVSRCLKWVMEFPHFVLDVNLSYLQIRGTDFVPFVFSTLEERAFPANNLVLELTESYFVQENQHVRDIFHQLRTFGVKIAMDDFGTGYSTLSILKDMPADIVKIDKTFIRDIRTSTFDATFIRFVVELCHDVGIRVCLEGVETDEEYGIVGRMGLDIIQGFLFGQPITAEEFEEKFLYSQSFV